MEYCLLQAEVLSDEDMALRKEDREWFVEEVSRQIQELESRLTPKGWRKTIFFLREWSILGVTATTFLALLALVGTAWNAANARLEKETDFRTNTSVALARFEERLANIQSEIRTIQAPKNPARVLNEIAPLSQEEFAKNIAALRVVTDQPATEINASPSVLQEIATKLALTNANSNPDYWPTVFKFVNFASGKESTIKPHGASIRMDSVHHNVAVQGQTIIFDGAILTHGRFDLCLIKFTNHPTRFEDVIFTNCVFEFGKDVIESPDPNAHNLARKILANLNSVSLDVPTEH
jgi:hypothetical protein